MTDWQEWTNFAANYGIGGIIVVFVGLCARSVILWVGKQFDLYVPPAIQSHLTLMTTLTDTQKKLAENQKELTENSRILTESMVETKKGSTHCKTTTTALLGLCETFEHASEGHPRSEKIKQSLAGVRTTLLTGNGH